MEESNEKTKGDKSEGSILQLMEPWKISRQDTGWWGEKCPQYCIAFYTKNFACCFAPLGLRKSKQFEQVFKTIELSGVGNIMKAQGFFFFFFLTSWSATRLSRGQVPGLAFDIFMCCHPETECGAHDFCFIHFTDTGKGCITVNLL